MLAFQKTGKASCHPFLGTPAYGWVFLYSITDEMSLVVIALHCHKSMFLPESCGVIRIEILFNGSGSGFRFRYEPCSS